MTGETQGIVLSAGGGALVALVLVVTTLVVGTRALRRGAEAYLATSVRGTVWRMGGALIGVGVCLALSPPSTAAFAVAFLVVYLAGHTMLALRFGGRLAAGSGSRDGTGEN